MKIFITLLLAVLCSLPSGIIRTTAQTRDTWRSVRTNNLFVIGNADPEKLRQVAAWLEFFHSAFARLVSRNVLNPSVPTTVIIFRDDASFLPFKPLYQGRPANVSGFFQPGDDVNYIAISLDPSDRDPFSTAFHEYVHLHVRDNIPGAPLWLNEGLAELYGSLQFSGNDALLGAPLGHYLSLLRGQDLLPLETLLSIGTNSPHYNEQEKTGIFYGQSWALVHYLMLGDRGRPEQFKRFLNLVGRGEAAGKAIEDTYGVSLATLEQDLRAYVRRGNLSAQRVASVDNPQAYASYTAMQRTSLTESEANYYLGDLLLHIGRDDDAERYFKQAIALDPGFVPAHASLGLLYVYKHRYADAKKYLQKAAASPQQNHLIHYLYALVLSREGASPSGGITKYSRENATVMREQLLLSIKQAPDYSPAYYLLALVNLVTDERLDEAVEMVQKARQLAPSKPSYALLLAHIHIHRSETEAARNILEPLTRDSDQAVRKEAESLLEEALSENSGSGRNRSADTKAINTAMIEEPVETGTSKMIGGESSGVAIRDGQTIEKSESLPTTDEVLSRYMEAIGGATAIKAVNTRVMKGTVDVAGVSRGGSFEIYAQAPNKIVTTVQAHPIGTAKLGYNGRSGWGQTVKGTRALKSAELASLEREADFYSPLTLKSNYAKVTLLGMSKIGYRDVYVVELQPTAGAVEKLYLDGQTYLPVRLNAFRPNGPVSEPVEIYFDDWREVDGIKFPFHISQSFPKLTLSLTVKEIRHNVTLDASMFEPQRH
jgi:Flp pilus assembly protein TadD/outer membrane lipoprotein-sorting protein